LKNERHAVSTGENIFRKKGGEFQILGVFLQYRGHRGRGGGRPVKRIDTRVQYVKKGESLFVNLKESSKRYIEPSFYWEPRGVSREYF